MRSLRRMMSSLSTSRIDLTASQRLFLAGTSAVFGILDTHRGDMIANITETTTPAFILDSLKNRMVKVDSGRRLLEEKPEVNSSTINFEELQAMPANTFGHAYYTYMSSHGYQPEGRTPVRFISDPDHAYIVLRYRQIHDFIHCLSRLPPTVLGEVALKWFEFLHFGLPMCAIASIAGPIRLSMSERLALVSRYIPWAIACNQSSRFLLALYFEEHFHRDLDEFRRQLGFIPSP